MSTAATPQPEHTQVSRPWRRSGTWMVLIMFAFAFAMIGMMYLYWELHTRPFRQLQIAINARYPNSMPRVIGGQHKSHQPGSKTTLRIVIAVDFDPTLGIARPAGTKPEDEDRLTVTETMELDPRVVQAYQSLLQMAKENTDLAPYEIIEIFLEHRRPEKRSRTLFAARTKEDWFKQYWGDLFAVPAGPVAVPVEAATAPAAGP